MSSQPAARIREARAPGARESGRIEGVIRFIQNNLDSDLSLARLSRAAGLSPFYLHRQFRSHTGVSLARLIRLLRLRRASMRLAFEPAASITDIALDSGFESPESFSRAFRQAHGHSPSMFRRAPRWQPWQVSRITQHREQPVNTDVELVEFPATPVAAAEYRGLEQQAYSATMRLVAWRREHGIGPGRGETYGVHYSDPLKTRPHEYRLDVCVSYDRDIAPNPHGIVAKVIPGGRCARIRHLGSRDHVGEAEYLYREWLPASGEATRDYPIYFHYVNVGPDVKDADMITDVYLPLR